MLGLGVREQYVDGTAGRVGDAIGHEAVTRWRNVGATDRGVIRALEDPDQVGKPALVRPGVVVHVGDDLAGRRL